MCGRSQRIAGRLRLRPDASQRPGCADAHVEEFILQRFDQLRHSGLRSRADGCESFTRRPSDAGNRIAQSSGETRRRRARLRTDGRQSLRRVDADVWVLVRERLDERAYRRTGPIAQRAEGTCGIASDLRILVSQCPSQRRLNRFCLGRKVDQGIDGVASDRNPPITKQVHEQRNGRRTDPPDDFQRLQMQVLIATAEELFQQGQRTIRALDQGGFSGCPDLRVAGRDAIGPVTGGSLGKIRTFGLARLRE